MTMGSVGQIVKDAEVFGADNERIGKITEVGAHYFLVQHGFLFHKALYLPMRTVARVDAHRVYLNVPKYEAEAMATEHLPAAGDAWYGTEDAAAHATADAIDETGETDNPTEMPNETDTTDTTRVTNQVTVLAPPETAVEMPDAEAVPTDGTEPANMSAADTPREDLHLLDRSVEIPLRQQDIVIEKTPVVTGEISIRKEIVTDTQHITDTVRREEAHVEATDGSRVHREGQPADARREDRTRDERLTEAERADDDRRRR